ncbi:MAG: hypothetical protein MUF31_18075 [Akkermansiaceae bacterium]|jgi:hypothetical protein|nr:hypothetical protein [Akkermansiaceae bacterium]
MKLRSTPLTVLLALSGLGLSGLAGSRLSEAGKLDDAPNPLGIHGSAYGRIIAMAIQAPIEKDWHGGIDAHGDTTHSEDHHSCGHPGCDGHHHHHHEEKSSSWLATLDALVSERTNPRPPSAAHQQYLNREIEKNLRFALRLDPTHFGNYNAYHHFLIESDASGPAGDFQQRKTLAVSLARETIEQGLADSVDPRPALTAASAAYNIIELSLLDDASAVSAEELKAQLQVLDLCLHRHSEVFAQSLENGFFDGLSAMRQQEILTRGTFMKKLRDAAATTIARRQTPQASTH